MYCIVLFCRTINLCQNVDVKSRAPAAKIDRWRAARPRLRQRQIVSQSKSFFTCLTVQLLAKESLQMWAVTNPSLDSLHFRYRNIIWQTFGIWSHSETQKRKKNSWHFNLLEILSEWSNFRAKSASHLFRLLQEAQHQTISQIETCDCLKKYKRSVYL